jgi:GT2 family glycosyltransferase
MARGKVSVIVPTFNRAYCLRQTLNSLRRQTYGNWEALVIDDGSTDDTAALVAAIQREDGRVVYRHQRNGGVSSARNAGLRLADGEWIAFLDSDDAWLPWKLEVQIACLERLPEVGMIWTDMDGIDENGTVVSRRHLRRMYGAFARFERRALFQHEKRFLALAPGLAGLDQSLSSAMVRWGELYSAMIAGSLVHTSTALLRASLAVSVGFFNEQMRAGEDYEFHLRVCRAKPVALLDVPAIHYRIAGGSDQLTASKYRVEIARNALNTRVDALARDRARISLSRSEIRRIIAQANAWLGEELFDSGEYAAARPFLRRGIVQEWNRARVLARALLALLPAPMIRSALRMRRGRRS